MTLTINRIVLGKKVCTHAYRVSKIQKVKEDQRKKEKEARRN